MKNKLVFLMIVGWLPISLYATDPTKSPGYTANRYEEEGIFYAAEKSNLLVNPEFESGTSYWTLGKYNGVSATFGIDSIHPEFTGKQAVINTSGSLENNYNDIQLFNFIEISQNIIYHITFRASVEKMSPVSISFSNGTDTFYEEKLLLRPGEIHYGPFVYKADLDESFTFFSLNLGRTNASIIVDDVLITADQTEKKFDEIISKSGINIEHVQKSNELYIQLPTNAKEDFPVIILNEKGNIMKTDKIRAGTQEAFINLQQSCDRGNYMLKVFAADKTLSYNFSVNK